MSKKLVLSGVIAAFSLFGGGTTLQVVDCNIIEECLDPTVIDSERFNSLLTELFAETSLRPMILDGPVEYHVTQVEPRGWFGKIHIEGLLRQNEMSLHCVTSIHKGWFWDSAELLYLSTEKPMDPQLFDEISRAISYHLVPEVQESTLVVLECQECFVLPVGPKYQTWKYFNESYLQEFTVALTETPEGKTTFEIVSDSNAL